MVKSKVKRIPSPVWDDRKKLAEAFNTDVTKAFIIQDKIIGKVLSEKKRRGKKKYEIEIYY